jgi:hypothetical protein
MSFDGSLESSLAAFLAQEERRAIHRSVLVLMGQELVVSAPTQRPLTSLLDRYGPYLVEEGRMPFGPSLHFKAVLVGRFPEWLDGLSFAPLSAKDALLEIGSFLVIKKVRSGLRYIVSGRRRVVWFEESGISDWNSAVNVVNDVLSLAWLEAGFLLFHAGAAATKGGGVVLIASSSGSGKTTTLLRLLGEGFRYVANDRVLVGHAGSSIQAVGFPKLPRVNPGTIFSDSRLRTLLSHKELEELASLGQDSLWNLEMKRDVPVQEVYRHGIAKPWGELKGIVFLEWSRNAKEDLRIEQLKQEELSSFAGKTLKVPVVGTVDRSCPKASDLALFKNFNGRVRALQAKGKFAPEQLASWISSNF